MSGRKVTHEIKLPLSLTIILGVIAFGLVVNIVDSNFFTTGALAAMDLQDFRMVESKLSDIADAIRGCN
mgnify:CR=1 FL=1